MGFECWIIPWMYERCGTFTSLNGVCSWKYEWVEKSWIGMKKWENVEILNNPPIHLNGAKFLENDEYFGKYECYEKVEYKQ